MGLRSETKMAIAPESVSRLMTELRRGSKEAAAELVQFFYPQLHGMAARQLRHERAGHTWQPTALVNELYLELTRVKAIRDSQASHEAPLREEAAFLGFAGHVMKRLLILHARPLYKRVERVGIEDSHALAARGPENDSLRDVEKAMAGLAAIDPALPAIVELKVFEGLTMEQIAGRLDCSERTAARRWNFARNWLRKHFDDGGAS